MSDDLLTTLRFEVDGSGVATGLTSVKRSITDLGNAVKDITDKTNAALGKVGTEELPVAKGLEKASKSIIKQTGDIEKAIATFGSTASTSLKQAYKDINAEEVRLRGMGIDAAIMNPYLEKLREVQKLTAAVAAQERTLAQGAAQAVEAENQRLAHTLELKRQIANVKTTVDKNNAAAQAAQQAEIEAQQKFKLLGLNNQIQAAQKAAADAQAAQSAKALKDFKDLAAAQAAFAQEVMNSELNFKHTGRGKSTEYLAEKARELGIDKQFADQKLANYRQIESASKAAFQAANPHLAEMAKRAEAAGTSVKGLSASMRNVPAQFTDIIVSLQGGQAPLTVLLQQGGQLKDMFGGVGNAARALGGYVLDLINPFTATAAAVAAVGYAAYQASEDAKALNKSLIMSNGASGTTIGELTKVAESITATSIGAGKASEALAEFITAGVKAGDSLGEFTKTAIELERVGGASIKETAKAFADLGKDPLSNLNVLTLATYRQVEALLEQGDKIGAVKVAQAALNQENERVTAGLRAQEGVLDTSTRYWKDLGVSVWDTVRGLSQAVLLTPKTGNEERQELQKRRDTYAAQGYDTTKEDARLAYFKRLDDAQKESVKNQTKEIELKTILANLDAKDEGTRKLRERNQLIADNTRLLEAGLISQKRYDDVLANFDKQKSPAKTAKAVESEYDKLIKKLGSELPKAAAEAEAAQNGYNKAQTEFIALVGGDSWGKFTNDQRATVAALYERKIASEQSEAATKALAKAEQEATKAHEDYLKKLGGDGAKEVASLEARVQKQAQHNAEIGKTAEQIEAVCRVSEEAATKELEAQALAITGRLEEHAALLEYGDTVDIVASREDEASKIKLKSLREQIALRKQIAKGYTEGEALEAGAKAAAATTAEWKRGWEETDRLARDVFTTWATDGSNAAQKIGDTLKKALLSAIYEATLKPIAFQLYTSIAGNGGAAGAVQAASGAGSSLSGLSNVFGTSASLFGAGFKAGLGSILGESGIAGGISAGTTAIGAGNVAGGLGTLAGAIGPVVVGLAALKSAMDYTVKDLGSALVANLGGGVTNVANRQDFQQTGGLFGGGTTQNSEWSAASAELTAYMDAQVKLVTESARAYGTALGLPVADLDSFKQQIEVSLTGLNADQAKEAINKAIGGFGDALVSASFGSALADLKREGEDTGAALARLGNDLNGVNAVFAGVQHSLLSVDLAGAATASSLVSAAGGLANFQAQVTAMYGQLDAARQAFADANRNAYELQEQAEAEASGFGSDSGSGGGGGGGTDALKEAIDYLAGASLNIRQWLDRLNSTDAGGLSADAQRTNAWAALQAQLTLARGGDRDALSGITGYADGYIDTINKTSKTEAEARLAIGKVRGQLAALPGQVSPEQFIVDAINANGGGAGAVATAVKSLGSKLTAELTVSARSEIVKMIEFVVDTDKLPNDLKQLALASADTMTKTVSFITGSKLSEENKQIALAASSLLTKTISYALGQDIPDEYKKLALKTSDSISKTISYIAKNLLDPKQAEIALMADNSIVKTIEMASKFLDADALKAAYAQSEVIRKMLEVSGGVLTPEQAMLLDNIAQYNKTINLFVAMDSTALDSAKDYIKRTLGTLDIEAVITGIPTTDDTGGVIPGQDVHKLLGGYINDLAKDGLIDGTDVGMIVGIVRRFGGTMADIAQATGWSLQQVIDFGAAWGIPAFAVGTDYIPRDMLAVVHKGEQIVPAAYNPHANGTAPGGANQAALVEEIRALRTDNQAQALALVQLQKRMNKLLERWDGNGMPETRVVTA